MYLPENKIKKSWREGKPTFGIYMRTPSPKMVEMLAYSGVDFVRVDLEAGNMNIETVENMMRAAHLAGITPIIRVPGSDERAIQHALDVGALGVIIPEVRGRDEVYKAVRAAKLPPIGDRHAGPSSYLGGYGSVTSSEYRKWAEENIIISVQIEHKSAVDELDEILKIEGLDMVQSGRGTLSYDYGCDGDQYHPTIIEKEAYVMKKGLEAGKMVAIQYYPMIDENQIEIIQNYVKQGVLCVSIGTDIDIVKAFRRLLGRIKA